VFKSLDKEKRMIAVEALATDLMNDIRDVIPILPMPLLSTIFLAADGKALRSMEIMTRCDALIDLVINNGAPMRSDERPRHSTIGIALGNLVKHDILFEEHDCYRLNPAAKERVQYYANSIIQWTADDNETLTGETIQSSRQAL